MSLTSTCLKKFVDELQSLVTGDETLTDVKLQVEDQIVPVCFSIDCFSLRVFYTIAGHQSLSRRALGRFSGDV